MAIALLCPGCKARIETADDRAGSVFGCPRCGCSVLLPLPPPPPLPPSPFDFDDTVPRHGRARMRWTRMLPGPVVGVCMCLFFACGIVGLYFVATNGAVPFVRPDIVGRWEPANNAELGLPSNVLLRMIVDFKRDGTGEWNIKGADLNDLFGIPENSASIKLDFKWHVEGVKKPVLVIDYSESKLVIDYSDSKIVKQQKGLQEMNNRAHFYYTLEENTLTLTPLQFRPKELDSPNVYRRARADVAKQKS